MRLTPTERMERGAWENPRARRLAADERAKGLTRSAWWMVRVGRGDEKDDGLDAAGE